MPLIDLPTRRERSAPSFDESQPEELERYFSDLEGLFDLYTVVNEEERKQAALRYLPVRTEHLWKTAETYTDRTRSFAEFRAEIFRLYPGTSNDRTYTIQDFDVLIGHYARTGIISAGDLGDYYRRFLLISRYLIDKGRISVQEQSRSFLKGFQQHLEVRIRQRLQQKFVDHFPDDPYQLPDVYEAASYVLMGTAPTAPAAPTAVAPYQGVGPTVYAHTAAITTPATDPHAAQLDALAETMANLGEMFRTMLLGQTTSRSGGTAPVAANTLENSGCTFCGDYGHFIRKCELVEDFISAGKCTRDPEGKVVLPTGAFVSRSVPGERLCDRFDEWHRQNPGQTAAQLYFQIAAPYETGAASQACRKYFAQQADPYPEIQAADAYTSKPQAPPHSKAVLEPQRYLSSLGGYEVQTSGRTIQYEELSSDGSDFGSDGSIEEVTPAQDKDTGRSKTPDQYVTTVNHTAELTEELSAMMMTGDILEDYRSTSQQRTNAVAAQEAQFMPTEAVTAAHVFEPEAPTPYGPYKVYYCEQEEDTSQADSNSGPATDAEELTVAISTDYSETTTEADSDSAGPPPYAIADYFPSPEPAQQEEVTAVQPSFPFPFRITAAPRISAPTLSFIGIRAPLTVSPGYQYTPTTIKVRAVAAKPSNPYHNARSSGGEYFADMLIQQVRPPAYALVGHYSDSIDHGLLGGTSDKDNPDHADSWADHLSSVTQNSSPVISDAQTEQRLQSFAKGTGYSLPIKIHTYRYGEDLRYHLYCAVTGRESAETRSGTRALLYDNSGGTERDLVSLS
jgi:hypothetical protein